MKHTSNMVSLLYASGANFPSNRANTVQQIKTAHAFARAGIRVRFWAKKVGNTISDPRSILAHYDLPVHPNFELIQTHTVAGRQQDRHYLLQFLPRAANQLRQGHFDVLYTRVGIVAVALKPAARLGNCQIILESHDLANRELNYRGISKRAAIFQNRALRSADRVVTVTQRAAADMVQAGLSSGKILVAPDAADPIQPLSMPAAPSEYIQIVYTGSLIWDRGVDVLVQSVAQLPLSLRQRVQLSIVGGQPAEVASLTGRVEVLGLRQQVNLVGYVPHQSVKDWLLHSHILVLPMHKTFISATYASPMKLFEYMAAGRPIVCSDTPSVREIVSEREVFFFDADDATSLARVLTQLVENWPEAIARASHAHQLFIREYTYDTRARKILQFLGIHTPPGSEEVGVANNL